jgi:peptidoglycan-associated lipoprotein
VVEGHCDERGTRDYNLLLGERRARAVKRVLEELGVPSNRVQTTSYGKERPLCAQHSDACWRQNRRVHLTIQ